MGSQPSAFSEHFLCVRFRSLILPCCPPFLFILFFIEKDTPLHSVSFLLKTCFVRKFRVSVTIQAEGWLHLGQCFSNLDTALFNGKKFSTNIRFFTCDFYSVMLFRYLQNRARYKPLKPIALTWLLGQMIL